jgi:AraC-like DNA-binding protein
MPIIPVCRKDGIYAVAIFPGSFFATCMKVSPAVRVPPHAYLVQLRLEHARLMLEKGEAIAEAALSSGFSD